MKTALFLMVPVPSHYFPTFGLAKSLKDKGFNVVYTGTEGIEPLIVAEDFKFIPLSYIEPSNISNVRVAFALAIKSILDKNYYKRRYRNFRNKIEDIELVLRKLNPDVVFLDDALYFYYPSLSKYRTVQLSTTMLLNKTTGLPPLNSAWVPSTSFLNVVVSDLLWCIHFAKRGYKNLLNYIAFPKTGDVKFLKKYSSSHNIRWREFINHQTSLRSNVRILPYLILAPDELEIKSFNEKLYYLYYPAIRNETTFISEEYSALKSRIVSGEFTDKKIAYVSLGSLAKNKQKLAIHFLNNVSQAFGKFLNFKVVVSTLGLEFETLRKNDNIFYFNHVPQMEFLKFCDVALIHGGLNSIKECIEAGVPMIVYPLYSESDQPGNGVRISVNKLGIRGRITDSSVSIQRQIDEITYNPIYLQNCQTLKKRLQQKYNSFLEKEVLAKLGILQEDSILDQ